MAVRSEHFVDPELDNFLSIFPPYEDISEIFSTIDQNTLLWVYFGHREAKEELEIYQALINTNLNKLIVDYFQGRNLGALQSYLNKSRLSFFSFLYPISKIQVLQLSAILKSTSITHLDIREPFDWGDWSCIAHLLNENQQITSLVINLRHLATEISTRSFLQNVPHPNIDDLPTEDKPSEPLLHRPLVKAIMNNPNFKRLYFTGHNVDFKEIDRASALMKVHPRLKIIYMKYHFRHSETFNVFFPDPKRAEKVRSFQRLTCAKAGLNQDVITTFRDIVLKEYLEETRDLSLYKEISLKKIIHRIAKKPSVLSFYFENINKYNDIWLPNGYARNEFFEDVNVKLPQILPELMEQIILNALYDWRKQNISYYIWMRYINKNNPVLPYDALDLIRSFLLSKEANVNPSFGINLESLRLKIDNLCIKNAKLFGKEKSFEAIAKRVTKYSITQHKKDLGWMREMAWYANNEQFNSQFNKSKNIERLLICHYPKPSKN